jgi:hypothetical protein
MTPYFAIYALVMLGVVFCLFEDGPLRRAAQAVYFAAVLVVLASFAGMRSPNVDRDFQDYVLWFNLIKSGDAPVFVWLRDPAFAGLSWLVAQLGLAYSAVAFIYALLGLVATWCFAAATSLRRWLPLLFYLLFCQYFIVLEMTEIRAAVAIPLMGIALYLACQGRRRRATAIYFIALIFHFSVIVALPFLVMLLAGARFRTRAWLYTMIAAGAIAGITMRSLIDVLSGLYRISEYLNGGAEEHDLHVISWYALAHLLTILIPVLFFWKKLTRHERLATLGCTLGLLFFVVFGWNTGLATRLLYVFDIYWLLIMMMILNNLEGSARIIYAGFLTLIGFALYCKSLQYVQPYSTLRDWDAMVSPALHFVAHIGLG